MLEVQLRVRCYIQIKEHLSLCIELLNRLLVHTKLEFKATIPLSHAVLSTFHQTCPPLFALNCQKLNHGRIFDHQTHAELNFKPTEARIKYRVSQR